MLKYKRVTIYRVTFKFFSKVNSVITQRKKHEIPDSENEAKQN